jgi:hypothetical protein
LENKLTALLLLITVVGSSFNNAIVLLQYNLNKQFIATTFCENRDNPGSCCQGKCYLKKQLQKDQDTGQNGSGRAKEKLDIDWFYETATTPYFFNSRETTFPGAPDFSKYSTLLSQVFHPPGQA